LWGLVTVVRKCRPFKGFGTVGDVSCRVRAYSDRRTTSQPDNCALGAPIIDARGHVHGSLTIAGLGLESSNVDDAPLGLRVRVYANQIGSAL
jgi:DNA-binding IclR family transcriptional regulator